MVELIGCIGCLEWVLYFGGHEEFKKKYN